MNVGELVIKDGIVYRIVAVPAGEVTTYSVLALHAKSDTLAKTVTSSQIQSFLVPSGSVIAGVEVGDLGSQIGTGSAVVQTVPDGYVKVIFVANGGSETDAQIIESGESVVAPDDPTYEGFVFSGWFDTAAGDGTEYDLTTDTFDVDTYVHAVWTEGE